MATLLVGRLCRSNTLKLAHIGKFSRQTFSRTFASENRETVTRTARRRTIRERAFAEPTGTAFNIGKGAVAGGAVVGLGALCYYGLGLSGQAGALDKSMVWPQYVRERITSVYMYFGGSLIVTATSAIAAFRTPAIMNLVMKNGFMGIMMSMAAIIGTGMLAQSVEYKPGFGPKQMAWLLHAGTMGAMLAPLCFLGGPILMRAGLYSAGIVGGLSAVSACAPSEKFLMMGGPLAMGLGVVFCASLGSAFLPPTTALGAGLYSISLYGGLLLFSGFLLYDTQRIVAQAERYPLSPGMYGVKPYDPINAALSIYMDALNIFVRIATILAGGGSQRKK
ncbi:growth hormone-inducible transmembrane protein [Agrilus planipennis]|uniref:Growth hormone-inducible transmembrane protein n=1 Tax=Agrilus planipennis TaxID=224129 RepID=A0A1W4XBK8_AGRPL|nr:growth hormone-inducible transmembrane protein [Agrilus planipennis]